MKNKIIIGILILSIVLLSGCMNIDPYKDYKQISNTYVLINQSENINLRDLYNCVELKEILLYIPNYIPVEPKSVLTWFAYSGDYEMGLNHHNDTENIYFTREEVDNYFITECIQEVRKR